MISELKEDLQNLLNSITISIQNSKSLSELENIRVNSLGKKGSITLYLKKKFVKIFIRFFHFSIIKT